MQTINLKQYYPFCTEDTFVEVSDEIVEAFLLDKRAEAARERKMYRYKAFYSLDCDDGIENAAIGWAQPSPEDCLMEKEAQAEYAELLRRLYEAISSLPPAQARRVHARYMLGMKVKDIAAMEGITPSQAGKSIHAALRRAAPVLHTPEMDKRPMKTINLKKYYYPICKKDTFVEVPDEVADAIVEESRAENANDAKQHYHCYSLDASPGIEHHFPEQVISPEDILMEKETEREQEAAHALMMERLREALATLTPRQASCLHARFWEGKQFKEIAEAEGFTTSAAIVTVRNAIIKLQKYYIKRGWMKPPKEENDMHKDSTTQAKQKKDEREEVLKEIRQLENRQKILENKQRNEERKARTRRLIERGAILEGIFPLAPDLPGVEVKAFLIALSHLPGAAELAAKLPKSGDKP